MMRRIQRVLLIVIFIMSILTSFSIYKISFFIFSYSSLLISPMAYLFLRISRADSSCDDSRPLFAGNTSQRIKKTIPTITALQKKNIIIEDFFW